MVRASFKSFIDLNIRKYEGYEKLNAGFVGSVAFHFKDIMTSVLAENDIQSGDILQSPMKGLIEYYTGTNELP